MKSRTNLEVEKNWKDNVRINGNEKRSTRLDVYDKDTNTVYDYKFVKNPGKGLSKRQVEKIKKELKMLRIMWMHQVLRRKKILRKRFLRRQCLDV